MALLFGSLLLLPSVRAAAPVIEPPSFRTGDTWVFEDTRQRGTNGFDQQRIDLVVQRVDGDTMLVGFKRDAAPVAFEDHVVGLDWSQRHLVDGEEIPTTRPLSFPMKIGDKWTVDYRDATRRNNQVSLHVHRTYTVKGWEDVTVPAGTFHAIRIDANGVSEGSFVNPATVVAGASASPLGGSTFTRNQPGGTTLTTVRDRDEILYVPEVKNFVKTVEEQYNSQDILVKRDTRTLVSFRPAA